MIGLSISVGMNCSMVRMMIIEIRVRVKVGVLICRLLVDFGVWCLVVSWVVIISGMISSGKWFSSSISE